MNSTLRSPAEMQTDTILRVKDVSLVYNLPFHHPTSWRDVFTGLSKAPLKTISPEPDRLPILQGISFEVSKGERIGILGVNGSGKTSLCRLIAGKHSPNTGKVDTVGVVRAIFETQIGIQPELTGRENAELLTSFLFPELDDPRDLIEEALEFSDLGTFIDAPFKLYSNGMKTRLSLSLISTRPADLLILDEVFDGADHFFKQKAEKRILDMIDRSGAVIFVSHSFEQIRKVCSRVIVLHKSKVAFDGPPGKAIEVYEKL